MIKLIDLLKENKLSGKDILIVDVQPSSKDFIHFNLYKFCHFINETIEDNNITVLYNGPELGYESKNEIIEWYLEYGLDVDILDNLNFVEKQYGFFRGCMDADVDYDDIVKVGKYMYDHDIDQTMDINNDVWEILDVDYLKEIVESDPMYTPWELYKSLKGLNNIIIMGGHSQLCLAEVQLALDILNKTYTEYTEFIYH